ncbi:MAG: hypothetical protein ACYDAC_03565 [Candidatus Dormibacteria bacterium]
MNTVDLFDRLVDDGGAAPDALRALSQLATEVRRAVGGGLLDQDDHDRIYARALAALGEAVDHNRLGWQRLLGRRPAPAPLVVAGAAAAAVVGAAVGWSLLHRHGRPALGGALRPVALP